MMIPFVIAAIESEDDRAVMTDIYLRNRSLMLKIAWQYTKEPFEVDDIVSESCVAMILHLEDLKAMEPDSQRAYIVTTVRHKAIDYCRKKAAEHSKHASVDTEEIETPVDFLHQISVQEEIDMVKKVFLALPGRERETLTMKYFEQKSNQEIADALGVSENAVRRYIMLGRSHIKASLYAEEESN